MSNGEKKDNGKTDKAVENIEKMHEELEKINEDFVSLKHQWE